MVERFGLRRWRIDHFVDGPSVGERVVGRGLGAVWPLCHGDVADVEKNRVGAACRNGKDPGSHGIRQAVR